MARPGWVALQRAARRGTPERECLLDMRSSFVFSSAPIRTGRVELLQPRVARACGPGRQVHTGGRPGPTVRTAPVGQNDCMTSTPPPPPAGRLRLTGFAFLEVLLAVPTLLFFVLTVVGG